MSLSLASQSNHAQFNKQIEKNKIGTSLKSHNHYDTAEQQNITNLEKSRNAQQDGENQTILSTPKTSMFDKMNRRANSFPLDLPKPKANIETRQSVVYAKDRRN